jgi:pyruvate dehydrogenase E2 component (dihydrolipoamide acetyltransferase)
LIGEERDSVVTEVVMPALGITVEKGKIIEWVKKEGDPVVKGEVLFVVETDKVTTEVESPASGILAKILVPVGLEIPVLTVVAIIAQPEEKWLDSYEALTQKVSFAGTPEGMPLAEQYRVSPQSVRPPSSETTVKAMPSARTLANAKGLDLSAIRGTGPAGTILLRDVETALGSTIEPGEKVSPLARRVAEKEGIELKGIRGTGLGGKIMRADVERAREKALAPRLGNVIQMNRMRQVISRRMSESAFSAPHISFFTDVSMDPLLQFKGAIFTEFEEKYDLRLSINDFLIKAVALNILEFPLLNAAVKRTEIHIWPAVNMGLAVALPEGLIVPAIANADRLGLAEITKQRADLVARARSGKLTMDEIERGTFTISSLAQYDVTCFTAILNPPQSGILTVGRTREEVVLEKGEVKEKKMTTLGLSVDHRIIDGSMAAEFLQSLKAKLERPLSTFLEI